MRFEIIIGTVIIATLGTLSNAYYYYFYVPSRLQAVPSIAEMDSFWTAIFSGELTVWLFSVNPVWGVVWTYTVFFLVGFSLALIAAD